MHLVFKFCFWYRSSDDPNDCKWGGWWGVWDGIKLKAQYLNSDNSMILIFQYHFWNISIINTIKCIIAITGITDYLKNGKLLTD